MWRAPIGLPSVRARKAAASAVALIPAPVRSSSRASVSQSSGSVSGRPAASRLPSSARRHSRSRSLDRGRGEVDHEPQATHERGVDIALAVGGEHGDAVELLHPLEQVVDLDVGEAVVGVIDLHPPPEQSVRLVEEQHHRCSLAGVEHLAQMLLGLADVLIDDAG